MSAGLASAPLQPYTTASKLESSVEDLSATLLSTHSMFEKRSHERRIIPANTGSVSRTWLDLYPPIETTEESALPAPPAQPVSSAWTAPNSKRTIRINTIKEILTQDIKSSIEIREHFLRLKECGREVCFLCSANNDPSANCGSTCAHLRPQISPRMGTFISSSWRTEATRSVKNYHRTLEEIEEQGSRARNSQVLTWEKIGQGLRKGALNHSEIKDENGWSNQVGYSKAKRAGVEIEWTFESAWGTDLPPDGDVAPDEDVPGDMTHRPLCR
ncbi:hypothetical protein HBI56_109650 [Parastagonospora nodorum]|uniref:Uncharacterized protein n=1 Tax=Phaeosphaeria nodorum (strain SN15 / ATCC MYA-4574 / FGSC 10173) TaxID=321614 RepID=A0A7U2ETS8_PHANO|nr:hypothetical protein HBH56_042200 [Parastagonospora nodorum]QRC92948.1 hypothetical protein JI435_080090 [Parastagonospora nodorum SN15]KAH3933293.1 hypothetical protein HBH54_069950 [Parastagonospora nodorum]KAH3943412.1 hypothetical protein HBH53_174120 [Parastagonospora nodorum]KAH3961866.1 hypothetical protein HBH52_229340 [Parastagonospora nodorum]